MFCMHAEGVLHFPFPEYWATDGLCIAATTRGHASLVRNSLTADHRFPRLSFFFFSLALLYFSIRGLFAYLRY